MLKVADGNPDSNNHALAAVGGSLLDELAREGARQMLAAAMAAEVAAYVDAHTGDVDADGHRLVVRNGFHDERAVATAAGAVTVRRPRVIDKRVDPATGERQRFASKILPAWARKSPQVAEVLPLLYLHGLSSGDFVPALEQFLGSAAGLSAKTVTRLTEQWRDEADAFGKRPLADTDYVYLWVDGIHLKVRLAQDKICLLVMIGVHADGTKELVALTDGYRESSESWASLLRDCKRRGMLAPVLAIGDGALGFWKAVRDVFPEAREQRCWFHVTGNVLACLPKSAHGDAKAALAEIWGAEDQAHAKAAIRRFADLYGAKFPKAVAKIEDHADVLLEFYNYPAEHWVHLRTTNPIESTFATVRLRQRVTKGPGSRPAGIAMAFKLIESAQRRWRAVNAPHLVVAVRAGARFEKRNLTVLPPQPIPARTPPPPTTDTDAGRAGLGLIAAGGLAAPRQPTFRDRPTGYAAPSATTQFCPPNPNALTSAVRTGTSRAVPGT